jgi:hypothetical protein
MKLQSLGGIIAPAQFAMRCGNESRPVAADMFGRLDGKGGFPFSRRLEAGPPLGKADHDCATTVAALATGGS